MDAVRESALRTDSGRKFLAAPGNRTCLSSVPVRRSADWATCPPQQEKYVEGCVLTYSRLEQSEPLRKSVFYVKTQTLLSASGLSHIWVFKAEEI